ncbi:MAG: acyl-CoA-binding protein [Cyclobacteriaceae bacterium]|nr:acyl-CoA-binding protein [Cyclobacteriaceae bacterium]
MEDIENRFQKASEDVKLLPSKPGNQDLLSLYALYKQASEGDCTSEPPSGFDFKALAKYNAWNNLKGLSKGESMKKYIALVDKLSNNH